MYRDELNKIWQQQKRHHAILTDEVREQLEEIIFKQRPLKLNSDRVGQCSLEPKNKRAKIARLECQRFRHLQDINNLNYFDPNTNQTILLNASDREKLIPLFENHASISFASIKDALGLKKLKGIEFNLERGDKKLKGNSTACKIRKQLPDWDGYDEAKQLAIVEDLLTITKKSVLKNRLMKYWGFTLHTAVQLCLLEFEAGHSNLSLKAINKLLPYLKEGRLYSKKQDNELLGALQMAYPNCPQKEIVTDKLGTPPETANPIVNKALHELRRVINAIIAEHGKPDAIRIEMARDLEMNTQRYQDFLKQQKRNTKANDDAEKAYQTEARKSSLASSQKASKADKLKYRLWQEQKQTCIYSGKTIDLAQLFSAQLEIDHILPYSQSLDDSYMNKVVCFASENHYKGQRTPIDAFSGHTDKWQQIRHRFKSLHKAKQARFSMTAADLQKRDFISTQLNDTRHISRLAQTYLAELGADISVSKGITTAWLRHQWGLNNLIGETDNKDRTDHRHHAIDAVVIACVDRRMYQTLVYIANDLERRHSELTMRDVHLDPPWHHLREDLELALDSVIIAHTPQRKLSGELHEVTGAGFIHGVGNVHRKTLNASFTQVDKIIDDAVKEQVQQHLARYDNNEKAAFAEPVFHNDGKTPIKRVRILQSKTTLDKLAKTKFGARDKQGKVFKWLAFGNLHHVEIIRHNETGAYSGQFVTMMEASHRAKGIKMPQQAIIKTDHGADYGFIMALHINDLVSVEKDGQRVYYRVQVLDSANKRISLRLHTAATIKIATETLLDRESTIPALMQAGLQKHTINAIGKLTE
jgi:CRISPR-associated endonuclease Csn1